MTQHFLFEYNVPVDNQFYRDPTLMLKMRATHTMTMSDGEIVIRLEVVGYRAINSFGMIEGNKMDLQIATLVKDWNAVTAACRLTAERKFKEVNQLAAA